MSDLPCGAMEGDCLCGLTEAHDEPHACRDVAGCGGQWRRVGERFQIVRIPGDIDGTATADLKSFLIDTIGSDWGITP